MTMHVTDMAFDPVLWGVPYNDTRPTTDLKRRAYCTQHAEKLRFFFLGMLAADKEMSADDKAGYYAWLKDVDWAKLLAGVRDMAGWKKTVDKIDNPIASSLEGSTGEYQRLFRCFKSGSRTTEIGVV